MVGCWITLFQQNVEAMKLSKGRVDHIKGGFKGYFTKQIQELQLMSYLMLILTVERLCNSKPVFAVGIFLNQTLEFFQSLHSRSSLVKF